METHGFSKHLLYGVWEGMVQRCYNKNNSSYKYYGGRGVTMCDEWRNDASQFIKWSLGEGWVKGLTTERKDVNGNYCPDNCTLIPSELQNKNTRKSRLFTVDGVTDTIRGLALRHNINHCTLWFRISKGMPMGEAVKTNLQRGKRMDLIQTEQEKNANG